MTVPHHWRECRPALLTIDGAEPPSQAEIDAMMLAWFLLPDADRQAFHRVCCHNSRAASDLRAIERIKAAMSGL